MVAASAAVAASTERWLDPQSLAIFFVVPIVLSAIQFGWWASLGGAVLSALALNYLFVEPRHTFIVARAQDAAALVVFAVVGSLVSAIAARARAAVLQAQRHADQANILQRLADILTASGDERTIGDAVTDSVTEATGLPASLIAADGRAWGAPAPDGAQESARWAMSTRQPWPDESGDADWRFWPVRFGGRSEMALGIPAGPEIHDNAFSTVEQIAAQTGVAMERARVADEAMAARFEVERERFKSELLAGVSHDLRTPLSSIVFTLQSLQRFAADHSAETRDELLLLAETEARKLATMVDALLDASRIGTNGTPVKVETMPVHDLLDAACAAAPTHAADRLIVDAPQDLPPLVADKDLGARALANVIANALLHGDGAVRIAARRIEEAIEIEVSDSGPGLGEDPERLFGMFVRGAAGDGRAPGLGLGLPLARRLLEAQGARIGAENRPGGGALFRILFPIAAAHVE